jgi:hypothetical protein
VDFKTEFDRATSLAIRSADPWFFIDTEDKGSGVLYITVARTWSAASQSERDSNLGEVWRLWKAANNGMPVAVHAVDTSGRILASKLD